MNLSEKFLEAMDILVDQALATSDRDYTIEGTVVGKVNDVLYQVDIGGGSPIDATANGVYSPRDKVLILVPKGNMSGTKVIIGRASGFGAVAYQDENEILNDEYMLVQTASYTATSGGAVNLIGNNTTVLWESGSTANKIRFSNVADFIRDLTLHRAFYVRCELAVTAARDSDGYYDTDGTYSLNFNFSDGSSYSLSIDDILGNPYEFSNTQAKYFILPEDATFAEDFTLSSITFTYKGAFDTLAMGRLEVYSMAKIGEGWAKAVVIEATTDDNLNDNSATIAIGETQIELNAITRYLGIKIANNAEEVAKIKYVWQIENNRVDSDGWITLTDTTSTITLKSEDLMCKHNEVRCYASYNGSLLSDTIELIDENWPAEEEWIVAVERDANDDTKVVATINAAYEKFSEEDLKKLYVKWYRESPSGHKLEIRSGETQVLTPVNSTTVQLENVTPIDAFNFAYSSIVAELILLDTSSDQTIRLFDKDQLDIDGEFPSIESYVTYYTAQPNGIGRPDQQGDSKNWLPGYKSEDSTGSIDFDPEIKEEKIKTNPTDYWYTKAEFAPWNKTNPYLWAVERLDVEGEDPNWTEPNVISVHPGPNYTIHLTNDNAFIIAESDGTTDDADFGDNTTIEVKLYEDNTVLTDYTGWTITATPTRVSIKQKENEKRIWQVTGFDTNKDNGTAYDDGYVVFTAINTEENKELEARFGISKIYKGANGQGLQGLTLSLDNDNDVLVRHPNGGMISTYPIVTAGIYEGTDEETDGSNIIECYWDSVDEDNKLSDTKKTFSGVTAKFENKKLTISWISSEVTEGRFIFKSGALSKDFKFKVITGTDDYDFAFDQTVFNLSNGGSASCPVKVKKTSPSGVSILTASDGKINLYRDNDPNPIVNWSSVEISNTATFIIKEGDFEWDTETIEVVRDGAPGDNGVDSTWLVANPSGIAVDVNGIYSSNSITFRAVQGNQAYSVGKFKIRVNNVYVGNFFSGPSYITIGWENDKITIFNNTYSNPAYFPIKIVTCELYTSSGVLLDDEPVSFNYISKSIRESTKLFCHASTEPTAPVLENGKALTFTSATVSWSSAEVESVTQSGFIWYKNAYDSANTTTPLWCVDYIEYTDGTASLTAVVLVHEKEPVYEIKYLYGLLIDQLVELDSVSKLLPWPRPTPPTTQITNNNDWSWTSTAQYNNIPYWWYWTFSLDTAQGWLEKCKYIYVSEQATINGKVKDDAWSTPKIYAVHSSVGITVEQAEMYLQAVSQGDGKSGVYSLDGGELVINADFIKTGVLTVGELNKEPLLMANVGTKKVSIGGFNVTNSYLSTKGKSSYNSNADGVFVGNTGIGLGKKKFAVSAEGAMTSTSGTIAGWTIFEKQLKVGGKQGFWMQPPSQDSDGKWDSSFANNNTGIYIDASQQGLNCSTAIFTPHGDYDIDNLAYQEAFLLKDSLTLRAASGTSNIQNQHEWASQLSPLGLQIYRTRANWISFDDNGRVKITRQLGDKELSGKQEYLRGGIYLLNPNDTSSTDASKLIMQADEVRTTVIASGTGSLTIRLKDRYGTTHTYIADIESGQSSLSFRHQQ